MFAKIKKNWKTSTVGFFLFLAAVADVGQNGFSANLSQDYPAIIGFLGAILGLVSKDANVTGGTIPATDEAKARVAADEGLSQ